MEFDTSIIKAFVYFVPVGRLPVGNKMVDGELFPLDPKERKELLERNLSFRSNKFLDKYSPVRRVVKCFKVRRVERTKAQFYYIVGKIALTHAAIEQGLKETLMVDWGVRETLNLKGKTLRIEFICGKKLRDNFLIILKDLSIPEDKFEQYKTLCGTFERLSDERNKALKVVYAFNQETAGISRVHGTKKLDEILRKASGEEPFGDLMKSWMPRIDVRDLEKLYNELLDLYGAFMKLHCSIKVEKIKLFSELCSEIGKTYPDYAFKNPYWYKQHIEEQRSAGSF